MNTIIIDDNPEFLTELQAMLAEYHADINILATASSVASGLAVIQKYQSDIDFIFLDIELPDGTAFDLVKRLNKPNFPIIFITANNIYAERAIRFAALDYIIKPIAVEDLEEGIKRATKEYELQQYMEYLEEASSNYQNKILPSRIAVKSSGRTDFVPIDNIVYLKANGNITNIYTKDKRFYPVKKIGDFVKTFQAYPFMARVHRSHIVNAKFVKSTQIIERKTYAIMDDEKETQIAVSTPYKNDLDRAMSMF